MTFLNQTARIWGLTFTWQRANFQPAEKCDWTPCPQGIFLPCSHVTNELGWILNFLSGFSICSCAENYFNLQIQNGLPQLRYHVNIHPSEVLILPGKTSVGCMFTSKRHKTQGTQNTRILGPPFKKKVQKRHQVRLNSSISEEKESEDSENLACVKRPRKLSFSSTEESLVLLEYKLQWMLATKKDFTFPKVVDSRRDLKVLKDSIG